MIYLGGFQNLRVMRSTAPGNAMKTFKTESLNLAGPKALPPFSKKSSPWLEISFAPNNGWLMAFNKFPPWDCLSKVFFFLFAYLSTLSLSPFSRSLLHLNQLLFSLVLRY